MTAAAREACLQQIRDVESLHYDEAAVDLCLTSLRERLAHLSQRDALCAQVEALLRAKNAPRALRLVEELPLSRSSPLALWLGLALLATAGFVGGLFALIHSRVDAARASAATAMGEPPPSNAIDRAQGQVEELTAAFLRDLGSGDSASAYARMSGPYRAVVTPARFTAATSANPLLRGASGPSLNHLTFESGAADGRGTLALASGERVPFKASYALDAGRWALTAFSVRNVPALPLGP